jgi:transposase
MAWFRIRLTTDEQQTVHAERNAHPDEHVRRKMLVLWLLQCGLTREKTAEVAQLGRATVQRYVAAFHAGGLDGLRQWDVTGPVSDLVAHTAAIRATFTAQPVRTIAEACDRIAQVTGVRRQPTQVRQFLRGLGLKWQRVRALPVPPKKSRGTRPDAGRVPGHDVTAPPDGSAGRSKARLLR